MIANLTRGHARFMGADDNRLDADVLGDNGPPVLLLHGGGQTRHAWRSTAQKLASAGYTAYALDQRGHGTSEWVVNGAYKFSDFSADVKLIAMELTRRSGARPIVVGASLGGIAALLAEGEPKRANATHRFSALVLVDITPRVDMTGVNKILGFMRAHAKEGFASIADAAQIVAEYLPHRPRPKSNEGLKKNLRRSSDGRWRWHWDPRFLDGPRAANANRHQLEGALQEAARAELTFRCCLYVVLPPNSLRNRMSRNFSNLCRMQNTSILAMHGISWRVIATIASPLPSYLSSDDCRRRPRQAPA